MTKLKANIRKELDREFVTLLESEFIVKLAETFPGARTFPQIIVDGEKIGGFTEFKALVDTSKLGDI